MSTRSAARQNGRTYRAPTQAPSGRLGMRFFPTIRQQSVRAGSIRIMAVYEELGGSRGGESGIRTHDGLAPMPVFKTGALNHSAISPYPGVCPRGALTPLSPHI